MTVTLTRSQFDQACKAYIDAHSNAPSSDVKSYPSAWVWNEHSYVPNLGYLSRTVRFLSKRHVEPDECDVGEESIMEEDDAAVHVETRDILICTQYVVYSATFQVPAFYFTLHDSSGSPLALEQIIKCPLFRSQALPSADSNTFALTLPDSSLALLSQGDHPTLGTPAWYFHPCNTSEVMGEIMREKEENQNDVGLRWMEVWFMVIGNVVDFFAGQVC